MFCYKRIFVFLSVIALIYAPTPAAAQSAIDGGSGLFFVQKAKTLGAGTITVGLSYAEFNYNDGPEWDGKSVSQAATYGISDKLDISVYTPWKQLVPIENPDPSGWADGLARLKYNFFDSGDSGISLSGIFLLTLPLGEDNGILGTGETNPGVMLALDKRYKNTTLSLNFGYLTRAEEEYDDQYLYGVGVEHMVTEKLGLIGEWSGYSYTTSNSDKDDNAMALVGARYYVNEKVSVQAAYGQGTSGDGQYSPNYYATVGFTLTFGGAGKTTTARPAKTARAADTGRTGGGAVAPPKAASPAPLAAVAAPVVAPMAAAPIKVILGGVHFKFDKSELTDSAKEMLRSNASKMKSNPEAKFIVEGNTCSIGSNGYNFKLGQRRAIEAKKFLVNEMGIDPDRLEPISYGEERPAYTNDTMEGRSLNRRVDFVIKSK